MSEPDFPFSIPVPLEHGIYRALSQKPRVPPAQASNFLPLTAAVYEPLWRMRSMGILTRGSFSVERELALMLEWTQPKPGERFLDAGCSSGLYARTLLEREGGLEVHALDYSLPFLKKAKEYSKRGGVEPVLVLADLRALPYQDGVFDGVVSGGTLNELTDLPRTLSEMARVLKPGGQMWQMYVTKAGTGLGRLGQGTLGLSGLRFVEPKSLEEQANAAGFRLIRAQYRGRVGLALFRKA